MYRERERGILLNTSRARTHNTYVYKFYTPIYALYGDSIKLSRKYLGCFTSFRRFYFVFFLCFMIERYLRV